MKLFNTLTHKIEDFNPQAGKEVSIYTCGPTVYDYAHIGNLRAFIFTDVLRRYLASTGLQLTSVMNITDVDDKTIHRSLKDYPDLDPAEALAKLTTRFEKLFLDDNATLNIDLTGTKLVRATEHIKDMAELIGGLHTQGIAYAAPDGIYFSIAKYRLKYPYGVLGHIEFNNDSAQHRINNDEYDKQDARDFALWKTSDPGEPSWEIEIDGQKLAGRPGWHIECSAMSTKYLGQPFDIHTGGIDLVFPHHENEIAQSKGASGQDLANLFVHNEHLLVDGKKMSKSLGNFYTLADVTAKDIDPLAFRLLVLMSHYRSQQNFTWEALESASKLLKRLYIWADLASQGKSEPAPWLIDFNNALSEDLNTPKAIAVLTGHLDETPHNQTLGEVESVLGLKLTNRADITPEIKQMIAKRQEARANNDYATSDKLRDDLQQQGIELEDTPNGPRWRRT